MRPKQPSILQQLQISTGDLDKVVAIVNRTSNEHAENLQDCIENGSVLYRLSIPSLYLKMDILID